MEHDNSELGHIPHVNMQELKKNVSELEARLNALQTDEEDRRKSDDIWLKFP